MQEEQFTNDVDYIVLSSELTFKVDRVLEVSSDSIVFTEVGEDGVTTKYQVYKSNIDYISFKNNRKEHDGRK